MSRRARDKLSIGLFPFLAVLICTMGALILVLLSMTGKLQQQMEAKARAREAAVLLTLSKATPAPEPETPAEPEQPSLIIPDYSAQREANEAERQRRLEAWEKLIREKAAQKERRRQQLAEHEADLDAAKQALTKTEAVLTDLTGRLTAVTTEGKHLEETVDRLHDRRNDAEQSVLQARKNLEDARRRKATASNEFAVVPYDGSSGTYRRPIYIECTAAGMRFLPEGRFLALSDMEGFTQGYNPLLAGAQTLVDYWTQKNKTDPDANPPPYVLLLVRPSGAATYYAARLMLTKLNTPFGYELLDDSFKLSLQDRDPVATRLAMAAIGETLRTKKGLDPSSEGGDLPDGLLAESGGAHGTTGRGGSPGGRSRRTGIGPPAESDKTLPDEELRDQIASIDANIAAPGHSTVPGGTAGPGGSPSGNPGSAGAVGQAGPGSPGVPGRPGATGKGPLSRAARGIGIGVPETPEIVPSEKHPVGKPRPAGLGLDSHEGENSGSDPVEGGSLAGDSGSDTSPGSGTSSGQGRGRGTASGGRPGGAPAGSGNAAGGTDVSTPRRLPELEDSSEIDELDVPITGEGSAVAGQTGSRTGGRSGVGSSRGTGGPQGELGDETQSSDEPAGDRLSAGSETGNGQTGAGSPRTGRRGGGQPGNGQSNGSQRAAAGSSSRTGSGTGGQTGAGGDAPSTGVLGLAGRSSGAGTGGEPSGAGMEPLPEQREAWRNRQAPGSEPDEPIFGASPDGSGLHPRDGETSGPHRNASRRQVLNQRGSSGEGGRSGFGGGGGDGHGSRWGSGARSTIGLEQDVRADIHSDRIVVGVDRPALGIKLGETREELAERLSTRVDDVVQSWGEPPQRFHWIPRLRFVVHPGGNQHYLKLQTQLRDWGVSMTVDYSIEPATKSTKKSEEQPAKSKAKPKKTNQQLPKTLR